MDDFVRYLREALEVCRNTHLRGETREKTWGEVCLDFVFSELESDRDLAREFYRRYPEYEGDLERFSLDFWQEPLDQIWRTSRRRQYILRAWERCHSVWDLDRYGVGEADTTEQWQKDNKYQWRILREEAFINSDYCFDDLDALYKKFRGSPDFKVG
jgi:hypothetical protein